MRMISEVPQESFPLRAELLDRDGEPGLVGDVAHDLRAGVVGYVALKPGAAAAIIRLCQAPASVTLPLLAGLKPFGKVWVEFASAGGERHGILGGTLRDGSVWARVVQRSGAGPARCLPIAVRRVGKARRVATDWQALMDGRWVDDPASGERWLQWAKRKLKMELLEPGLTPEEGFELLHGVGVHDLIVLAAATSPRFLPDIPAVVRAARA
jgi:hypothetical protein